MKRKLLAGMLSALLVSGSCMPVFAEDGISGKWGSLDWVLEHHVLTVSGNGCIHTDISFADFDLPEWHQYNEDIYEIILEEGVTGADAYGLSDFPNLKKITLPSTFMELEPYVLSHNPELTEINGIEWIEVFDYHCLSDTAYIAQNPFVIRDGSLYYAEGISFDIPEGVTEIKPFAFGNCTSTDFIDFSDVQDNPVAECRYYEIKLPDSVTKIDDFAFAYCATMTNICIPESVIEIGDYAFFNCVNLNNVILSKNIQSVGANAFFNCKNIKNFTVKNPAMQFGKQAFGTITDVASAIRNAENLDVPQKELYLEIAERDPLIFDLMASAVSIEFLDASRYDTVMWHMKEQEITDITTQGVITGYSDSTAQKFAQENNLPFKSLEADYEIGDVNLDDSIDILDVILLNKAILGKEILTPEQRIYADGNADDKIDSSDSLWILKKIVNII